jgi:hypothetical protein
MSAEERAEDGTEGLNLRSARFRAALIVRGRPRPTRRCRGCSNGVVLRRTAPIDRAVPCGA